MKLLGRVSAVILCGLALAATFAQSGWQGTYEFTEVGGKTTGGSVIVVTHQLKVFEKAGGLGATLTSNGYQTSTDLNCSVKIEGRKLQVYFESYGKDNMFNLVEKGDLLLTLERTTVRGKSAVVTHWGTVRPIMPRHEKPGRYFTKTGKTHL